MRLYKYRCFEEHQWTADGNETQCPYCNDGYSTREVIMSEQIFGPPMRQFESGATRNIDTDKIDPEGFLSPLVIQRFCQYMHKNRLQADGKLRDSDNWQKGIPLDAYMKSMFRHFLDVWTIHRGQKLSMPIDEALCAVMFNAMGYLHEIMKEAGNEK